MSDADSAAPDTGKVWTADELLAMSPNDRYSTVHDGLVNDINKVPAHLLKAAQDDIRTDVAKSEAAQTIVE